MKCTNNFWEHETAIQSSIDPRPLLNTMSPRAKKNYSHAAIVYILVNILLIFGSVLISVVYVMQWSCTNYIFTILKQHYHTTLFLSTMKTIKSWCFYIFIIQSNLEIVFFSHVNLLFLRSLKKIEIYILSEKNMILHRIPESLLQILRLCVCHRDKK